MALCAAALAGLARAELYISEFMAANNRTIADGHGVYSDWIELHNSADMPADITGWYLTDNTNNLRKWRFPAVSVPAHGFLLVFASGAATTNYTDPLGFLHTTFRLARNDEGEHESVALVHSDGTTIIHAYLDYPPQREDVSYGFPGSVSRTNFVVFGTPAAALIPTGAVAGWAERGFDDSGWALRGALGAGYQRTGATYQPLIGLDVGAMYNVNASVYIRAPFVLTATGAYSTLILHMRYDDGFIAYLNGVRVAASNAPASPVWNSQAPLTHDADVARSEPFDISPALGALVAGTNVLAFHGLNRGIASSDLLIMPELEALAYGAMDTTRALYLPVPTPAQFNSTGVCGYIEQPLASVPHGFYSNTFSVALSCATPGAAVYYTLDAGDPAPGAGALYTNPLLIARTTVLRAAAFTNGFMPSFVATYSYLFVNDIVTQSPNGAAPGPRWPATNVNGQVMNYGMDPKVVTNARYASWIDDALLAIPTISLVSDPANLFNAVTGIYVNPRQDGEDWERPASVELIYPDGRTGFSINAGVRLRGGVSRSPANPKHSFRLFFRAEYGAAKLRYPLFEDEGADTFDKIDLRTSQNFSWNFSSAANATWLDDIFSRDTMRAMGRNYSRGRFYHLYLNGVYWGLYQTDERIEANYGESYFGGGDEEYDAIKSDNDNGQIYATDGTVTGYTSLWGSVVQGMANATNYYKLQGLLPDGTRTAAYPQWLDADNIADYMLSVFFTGNRDMPIGPPGGDNMPRNMVAVCNRVRPRGVQFVTHDAEHSLLYSGGLSANRVSVALKTQFGQVVNFTPWWLHIQLMSNSEYRVRFADRVQKHFIDTQVLSATASVARLRARAQEIDLAIIAESARWGDYLTPATPRTRDTDWVPAVNRIVSNYFIATPATRTDIVMNQLLAHGWFPALAAPVCSPRGAVFASTQTVSISAAASIYYTLDLSDPRTPVSGTPRGTLYSAAFTLSNSAVVAARTLQSGAWSALSRAAFIRDVDMPLRITELMYDPPLPALPGPFTNADFEFIEIQNTGTQTLGLAGVILSGNARFDFSEGAAATLAPGGYVVLVSNLEAFQSRYPHWTNILIAGEYNGRFFQPGDLRDSGAALTLTDGLGREVQSFTYDGAWCSATRGAGYSLTIVDAHAATGQWNANSAWLPSSVWGGTPGYGDRTGGAVPLYINEFMALNNTTITNELGRYEDWIELYNAGISNISLAGMYISDSLSNPTKGRLPERVLAPREFLVLWADETTNLGPHHLPFKLSGSGEAVGIYQRADSGTALIHAVSFPAQFNDMSYGLYPDAGTSWLLMAIPTPGTNNIVPEPVWRAPLALLAALVPTCRIRR